jgi:hypothetical protein
VEEGEGGREFTVYNDKFTVVVNSFLVVIPTKVGIQDLRNLSTQKLIISLMTYHCKL